MKSSKHIASFDTQQEAFLYCSHFHQNKSCDKNKTIKSLLIRSVSWNPWETEQQSQCFQGSFPTCKPLEWWVKWFPDSVMKLIGRWKQTGSLAKFLWKGTFLGTWLTFPWLVFVFLDNRSDVCLWGPEKETSVCNCFQDRQAALQNQLFHCRSDCINCELTVITNIQIWFMQKWRRGVNI